LSPRKAIQSAERLAGRLIGERKDYRRQFERNGICLKPIEGGWVWLVRFEWDWKEGTSTGIPNHLYVVVLMDGTAVSPEVHERNWPGELGGENKDGDGGKKRPNAYFQR
jgi:hypothetical protein